MPLTFSQEDLDARGKVLADAARARKVIRQSRNGEGLHAWLHENFNGLGTTEDKLSLYGIACSLYEQARTVFRSGSKATTTEKLVPVTQLGQIRCSSQEDLRRIEDAVLIMAREYSLRIDGVTVLAGARARRTAGASTLIITVNFDI